MEAKRKRLLELIKILRLPLTAKEAKEHIINLSDEDVDMLVSTYEDILNFQNAVSESVHLTDPENYEKLDGEYEAKVEEIETKHLKDLENLQAEKDDKLNEIDKEISDQVEKTAKNINSNLDFYEESHDDLDHKLDAIVSSN